MTSLLLLVMGAISLLAVPLFGLLAWAAVREAHLRGERRAQLVRIPVRIDDYR